MTQNKPEADAFKGTSMEDIYGALYKFISLCLTFNVYQEEQQVFDEALTYVCLFANYIYIAKQIHCRLWV